MYSQNNEQEIIEAFFKDASPGKLVDIGAYDGKTFSNTLRLLELGWAGCLVEPSPSVFLKLMENTLQYKPMLVNCAISTESKLLNFYDSGGDAISSFDLDHVKKWEAGYQCKFTPYFIKTITIQELFSITGPDIDFINLDVEGLNFELFNRIHYHYLMQHLPNLRLICVEHDGKYEEIESVMKPLGFKKLLFNGENIILGRD
jgi:FkbM family methyltransferase